MREFDRTRKCRLHAIFTCYSSKIRWICKANSPVWIQSLTVIGWVTLPVTCIEFLRCVPCQSRFTLSFRSDFLRCEADVR